MTALSELTCLHLRRPRPGDRVEQVIAFYEQLAVIHEHLAREAQSTDDHLEELAHAINARRHARKLRTETNR